MKMWKYLEGKKDWKSFPNLSFIEIELKREIWELKEKERNENKADLTHRVSEFQILMRCEDSSFMVFYLPVYSDSALRSFYPFSGW